MSRFAIERLEGRTLFANLAAATPSELIARINAANQSAEADTITLAAGTTFSLTAVDNYTVADGFSHGATGLPVITAGGGPLTILGNGDTIERSAAEGTPGFRLFDVAEGASLTLKNLTLQGGFAYSGYFQGGGITIGSARGGAIYNRGALALDSVTVQNNTAQGNDGIEAFGIHPGAAAMGGGIYSSGSLILSGCTIRNNRATGGRGLPKAWYEIPGGQGTGSYEIVNTGTKGGDAFGGGMYIASGTAVIRTSNITANSAIAGAGDGKSTSKGDSMYLAATASVGVDNFTKRLLKKSEVFGQYTLIA